MRRAYGPPLRFGDDALETIRQADAIAQEYEDEGLDLTLRQLHYQFVARGYGPNTERAYNRLGDMVTRGRYAGLLDWEHIVDRTREVVELPHWIDPAHIVRDDSRQFNVNRWDRQPHRVEVWVEKEALAGVVERITRALDVPSFACRGYSSASALWAAGRRIGGYLDHAEEVTIIHLGDHDPSGIDMTRDIEERLRTFLEGDDYDPDLLTVDRIALNMDQVRRLNPPPNPAKSTDSRFREYRRLYGPTSWELDALDPRALGDLITSAIVARRDEDLWTEDTARQDRHRAELGAVAARWADVVKFLDR